MSDMNSVVITGFVSRAGVKEGQYPRGWLQVKPENIVLKEGVLQQKPFFVGMPIGQQADRDRAVIAQMTTGVWVAAFDLTLGSYEPKPDPANPGQPVAIRRELKANAGKFQISAQRGTPENLVVLRGTVKQVYEGCIELGCSYLNPKAQNPQDKWKENVVRVYLNGFPYPQPRQKLYVRGRLSSVTPANEEMLCVIADVVA